MAKHDNVIRAFSAEHVIQLTGLSKGQLQYWDKTGFFEPKYASENRKSPFSRIYSFRDVVGLRTIAVLRNEYGISLQHLRQVAEELSSLVEDVWAETTLYVFNKHVYFKEPTAGKIREALSGQYAAIPLKSIAEDITEKANRLRERSERQIGQVERHRFVAHNAWVISGTRIPIRAIKRFVEAGYTTDQILREYPSLSKEDVEAALSHEEKVAKSA